MRNVKDGRVRPVTHRARSLALVAAVTMGLSACDLAPEYHPQTFLYPNGWQGKGIMVDAKPSDSVLPGNWWVAFNDPILNGLEDRMLQVNPDLQAAAESFTQARDMAREAQSQLYPQIAGGGHMSDNKASVGRL